MSGGESYKGALYDNSTRQYNQNINTYSSPGCPRLCQWKPADNWKPTDARTSPTTGIHKVGEGAGGAEAGVGEDTDHATDPNPSSPYFIKPILRVHLNPVPPGSPNFKAPRSPWSGNTLPVWANSTMF